MHSLIYTKSLLNIFRVAAGSIRAYRKAQLCGFQAIFTPFLSPSPPNCLEWPGTTSSSPRQPDTTLWATFNSVRVAAGLYARLQIIRHTMSGNCSKILIYFFYFYTIPIAMKCESGWNTSGSQKNDILGCLSVLVKPKQALPPVGNTRSPSVTLY